MLRQSGLPVFIPWAMDCQATVLSRVCCGLDSNKGTIISQLWIVKYMLNLLINDSFLIASVAQ